MEKSWNCVFEFLWEPSFGLIFLVCSVFQQGSPVSTISNFSTGSLADDFKDDPFKSKDPFGGGGGTAQADPFSNEDPFKSSKYGLI